MGLLERIDSPEDLKSLSPRELRRLAGEIREELIRTVTVTGGHLASNLGVVELTLALHRVFQSPRDKIIWDVGHQSYCHKLVTGRREKFPSLRQYQGLSGFTSPEESPHDPFGAGHASTSISAAVGMALARDLKGEDYNVIAVIGDGALGGGMAFEALNHAGHLGIRLIVVLNDNGMAISPSVGALARLLNKLRFDPRYEGAKQQVKRALAALPMGRTGWRLSKRLKNSFRRIIPHVAFWEELGFLYLGPVDGHDIEEMEAALRRAAVEDCPVLVHVVTQKGKGYPPAEADAENFHGLPPREGEKPATPSYSRAFAQSLALLMETEPRLVAITAAMARGTGLHIVSERFPDRVFDVGICEQHAVTMAAGMASQGFIPVVAIYSTFLQRAYDQIVHDVCLQNLPVVFALDRAGLVGEDGKTHNGAFDLSFLRCLPNMVVAAPKDGRELSSLLYTATKARRPFAIRYPRDHTPDDFSPDFREIPIGSGELLAAGRDLGIVATGSMVYPALEAARLLAERGVDAAVVNARFIKPLDRELVLNTAGAGRLLTVEENAAGGLGAAVLETLAEAGMGRVRVSCLTLPDRFVDHGPLPLLRSLCGLDAPGIVAHVFRAFPELEGRER